MADRPMHTLSIETTFDDGHVSTWAYDQPGLAKDAHGALAMRWRAAGATFTRDDASLTLTRHYPDLDRGGPYTDVIRHIPWEDRP